MTIQPILALSLQRHKSPTLLQPSLEVVTSPFPQRQQEKLDLTPPVSASARFARPSPQLARPLLCYLDSFILNLVIIVIWITSFGLHIIICYACITLKITLAAKILNIQGISYQFIKMLF
jgi:hypothetical protein